MELCDPLLVHGLIGFPEVVWEALVQKHLQPGLHTVIQSRAVRLHGVEGFPHHVKHGQYVLHLHQEPSVVNQGLNIVLQVDFIPDLNVELMDGCTQKY